MVASGKSVLVGLFFTLSLVSLAGYLLLRETARVRFAVGVYSVPDSGSKLRLDRPILLRIEMSSAGRSSQQAVGLLLSEEGRLLAPMRPLSVGKDPGGHPTEEVEFPPLLQMPDKGLLSAGVVRLPRTDAPSLERLRQAIGKGGPIHVVFGRLASEARALGGHAELVVIEIRAP